MPLGHHQFRALNLAEQLAIVLVEGTYLARRYEEEDAVNLYHLGTFFCEVYYNQRYESIERTRTFTATRCLEDYAAYISLADLLS
ncbi:hypothetical protein Q5H93_06145 [Hymenobacter sp. ASUV-10]|uniref:Uncharacterized protein n=1 Tax=Hymenobacter aranciens TaxID=3063996 RepID=A0ABT9B7Q0_9BACT|nr:hypothetical protein [Hymenobacter sp. ASUV-10]MDO7874306.1 hypothetical protein [Hymenobacter sp. ASUV-10]